MLAKTPRNPGNTGQRFTMKKVVDVELKDGKIHIKMECGHDYSILNDWSGAVVACQVRIGKRQRCNRCKVEVAR